MKSSAGSIDPRRLAGSESGSSSRQPAVFLVILAIFALALILRVPRLLLVPHLTDETVEVLWAHDIAFNGARPLTHADAYYGPLWPYLLAVCLRLVGVGSSLWVPRLFTMGFGLLGVALTFAIGRTLARRGHGLWTASVAALLLAVNFTHALVLSRVAWENSTSPVWALATALALLGVQRRPESRRRWALAGALAGLTLHTHPSLLVFLVALAVWILIPKPRAMLATAGPWLALGFAALAYSPMLLFNVLSGGATFGEAGASSNVAGGTGGLLGWPLRAAEMVAQLGRTFWGGWRLALTDGVATHPDPAVLVSGMLGLAVVAGTFWMAKRAVISDIGDAGSTTVDRTDESRLAHARRLPAIVVATALVGLPLVNRNWSGLLEARYLGYLLPFACVAIADGLATLKERRRVAALLVTLVLCVAPVWSLWTYERQALAAEFDNSRYLRMLKEDAVDYVSSEPAQKGERPILVDRDLKDVRWSAGGNPRRVTEFVLTAAGSRYEVATREKINHYLAQHSACLLYLSGPTAQALSADYALRPLNNEKRPWEDAWGLYRCP